ncbi:(R,R)-butanediol dehydrogenase/meso-butanediol dehydrogenase/diacetyl reductase [Halarchaeum solikamskense]|uniref:zinc-dependent alcohol dehydrogenase n=1 Tax=Halarchaeum nitratireducens TaxID=489913 RepID=UPI001B3B14FF|nr:zinc-binding dehydrogenase [Halarchaeum solikamskense]MBP2249984.1 (R,R)-butanediol dehydrogenase/meso-butanediol dehydrogenase/diacetyl reductase [Halarchaeum solikamskense]
MRAALFYGPEDMRVEDVDEPNPGEGEVLVDVAACGICGSDLHFYTDGLHGDADYPTTLGHEIGGTVLETGAGVDIEVGTDVVLSPHTPCMDCWWCENAMYNLCRDLDATSARPGGYAERVVERADNALVLPDGVSPADAAIAQPISVGLHAVRQSPVGVGDSAVVVGAGPIGLGAVRFAASAGAGPVYVSEPQASRRDIAADFGADVLIDPEEEDPVERIHEETGTGADVAFEAVGHEATLDQAVSATRAGGHTTVIGVFGGEAAFEPQKLVRHQRTVAGSTSHQLGPRVSKEYDVVLRQLASGELDADDYVTSRIDLEDVVDRGFETLLGGESEERKILVCP